METKKIKRTTKVKTLVELFQMEIMANNFNKVKEYAVAQCKYEDAAKFREEEMDLLIQLKKDLTVKLADVVRKIGTYKKTRTPKVKIGSIQDYINYAGKMADKLIVDRAGWSRTLSVKPKKTKKPTK